MKFVNREKEIKYLKAHFASEPNSLLFLYGPKSSGKTTLLNEVINGLDSSRYIINSMNLRGVIIYDFRTFLDAFFHNDLTHKILDLMEGITVNTGFFSVQTDEMTLLKKNAFKVMEKKLISAKNRGKQPVMILDEIQLLKNITLNGERYLIDELFNLFIRLTKELHTAHVVLSTSDSYYIEEVYNNAKLLKTTKLYFIDHFDKNTTIHWLKNEKFKDAEIENIWQNLGGSPWEIQELMIRKNNGEDVNEICKYFVNDHYGKVFDYVFKMPEHKTTVFYEVIKIILEKGFCYIYEIKNKQVLVELIKEMVAHDFWFYKVDEQKITANSQSLLRAYERFKG